MRPELELIEKIEQYLKDRLSPEEKTDFESEITSHPDLQEKIQLQRELMLGIERMMLKQKIQKARQQYSHGKKLTRWGLGGLAVVIIGIAAFFFFGDKNSSNEYSGNKLPEYNEQGEKQWADADREIPAQTFFINTSADTVIETKGGIVMAVPAHCFSDENGNSATGTIQLAIKEALDPAGIMNAGLSTTSGGNLLETGGMFFIDARKEGKQLKIDASKPLYTEIPAAAIKEDMQLFTGNRMPDGSIDWIDPKPLEHDLVPVDIHTLNFYPPGFLDSLQQWGYDRNNKTFTDSLYYAMAAYFTQSPPLSEPEPAAEGENVSLTGDWEPREWQKDKAKTNYRSDSLAQVLAPDRDMVACGINPAKIKAIWDDKFQNTILATREFEERLVWIHYGGDEKVLDFYINNLDKELWVIDSLAALQWHLGGSDATNMLLLFAARHDGKVRNGSAQFEKLRKYYKDKSSAFAAAIKKTQHEFWSDQAKLDREAEQKKTGHKYDSMQRVAENFNEEFSLNLKEAYRQLGYDTNASRSVNNNTVYRATITSTGWHNVDKYVFESTASRTTLDYTDPASGKKAVINYTPVSIQVAEWDQYDQLYVYLLPDELSSFMRLDGGNGMFSEKLNELISYRMVCIAYKGEQGFFYSQPVQPGQYPGIHLTAIGKGELDRRLNSLENQSTAVAKEQEFFRFYREEQQRQAYLLTKLELTRKIISKFLACGETDVWIQAR